MRPGGPARDIARIMRPVVVAQSSHTAVLAIPLCFGEITHITKPQRLAAVKHDAARAAAMSLAEGGKKSQFVLAVWVAF